MARNTSTADAAPFIRASFLAACAAVLVTEAIALAGLALAPHRFLSVDSNAYHPFFSYAMGGTFAIHALARPAFRELARASIIGFLLLAIHGVLFGVDTGHPHRLVGLLLYYQGLGSAAFLCAKGWRLRFDQEGQDASLRLMAASTLPLFVIASRPLLALSSTANPGTLDLLAFDFDRSLGFDPSAALARLVLSREAVRELALAAYASLPLVISIAVATQLRNRDPAPNSLLVFMVIAVIGFPVYFLFPVAGPIYAFGAQFPYHLPAPTAVPVALDVIAAAPRNGMPSLHFAWAFALWLNARNSGAGARFGYGAFLWLTLLAVLGLGEHYLIDLVVALPLVLVALALCASPNNTHRRHACWSGSVLFGAWLCYLAWGASMFAVVGPAHWLPMALTLLFVALLGSRLVRGNR
jgi:ribosomal protein S14